jgi:mandelate racemase
MAPAPKLTIRRIRGTAVSVPMRRPLGTSAQTIRHAPLLLIDLETHEGITGRTYLFCYVPAAAGSLLRMLDDVDEALRGLPVAPMEVGSQLARRFRLIGVRGIVAMALAGVDVACWDALAIAAGMPLARFLGGSDDPIPAYNSNGLGLMDPEALADEAEELTAEGFAAVKLRLGRAHAEDDLAAVRAVRERLPKHVQVMADFNQALTFAEARRRCSLIDPEGLHWIEEPIRHDDYAGCAALARELSTPIQIGENFAGPLAMSEAIAARAAGFMMPDLERIGGVSGWIKAAALASCAGIELSSHLFPEASVHLLAATPTAHWLEYVDWASPVLEAPLAIEGGMARVPDRPGTGITWNEEAVARYRLG